LIRRRKNRDCWKYHQQQYEPLLQFSHPPPQIFFFFQNKQTKIKFEKMNCELMLTYDTPAYTCMFNVYKNQSRQTGSRNLMGPKPLPTIWGTNMKLVTKYQISAIDSCWEKCDEKYFGQMEGRTEGRTEVKQYTPPSPSGERGYKNIYNIIPFYNTCTVKPALVTTSIISKVI
jgi:hypothetical protein